MHGLLIVAVGSKVGPLDKRKLIRSGMTTGRKVYSEYRGVCMKFRVTISQISSALKGLAEVIDLSTVLLKAGW